MPIEEGRQAYQVKALDGGLVTYVPAHLIQDSQSPAVQNFDPTNFGSLKKRLGYIKFTSAAKVTPTGTFVSGLYAAALTTGTVFVLASEGTALHDISAGGWGTTISGVTLTADTPVRMRMFNDKFLIANQGGGPYQWTGSGAATALGGSPPASARGIEIHRSRVWLYTNTSTLYFSALNNEADWTSADNAGSMTINKGDGFVINGFCSGGDFAVISKVAPSSGGKEGALYVLYNGSPFDFAVKRIASVGATGQEGMIAYDNFVAVATSRGIYGIQGRKPFKLSKLINPTWMAIPNKGTAAMGRYQTTLRVAYPASGSANNRELILDVERGVWGLNTGKTPRVYTNHPDGRLLFGTSGASILVWEDESGTNDDGSAINFSWDSADFDFGASCAPKRLVSTHVHAANTGNFSLTVDRLTDGTAAAENQTMNVSTEGPVKKIRHNANRGKFQRVRVTNNAADQPVTLYGITSFGELFEPGSK